MRIVQRVALFALLPVGIFCFSVSRADSADDYYFGDKKAIQDANDDQLIQS